MRSLTFRGSRSVTIPARQVTGSDATGLHVTPLESLTVTLCFAAPTGPATFHEDGLTTTYRATGDHARDSGAAATIDLEDLRHPGGRAAAGRELTVRPAP